MILYPTVYMNGSPVTWFVQTVSPSNSPGSYYRQCLLVFKGWHDIDITALPAWDVYASHDPTDPRGELIIRNGVIPPDQPPRFTFDGGVPTTEVMVYDWAWLAQRVRDDRHTLVIASDATAARRAVMSYVGPVGDWRYLQASTLHQAITQLAALVGMWIDIRLPNARFSAKVFAPGTTLWNAILQLAEPFAPEPYFRRAEGRMLLADRAAAAQGAGSSLALSEKVVKSIAGGTRIAHVVRRVLVQVPRWL